MYDYQAVIPALDAHWQTILPCIAGAIVFSFIYFSSAVAQCMREKVYVESFIGASVFFWHDGSYVLFYDLWFNTYNHWWFKAWWFALIGTAAFEAWLIYLFWKFAHKELWPSLTKPVFGVLVVVGTLAVGTFWFLIKGAMQDDQYFITFAITAIWSAPFHTAIMCMRKNRAGQSIVRQLCMAGNLILLTAAFAQVAPGYFLSPIYLAWAVAFALWPLANIWLIRQLPPAPAAQPA